MHIDPKSVLRVVVLAAPSFAREDAEQKLQIAKANAHRLALEKLLLSLRDTLEDGAILLRSYAGPQTFWLSLWRHMKMSQINGGEGYIMLKTALRAHRASRS